MNISTIIGSLFGSNTQPLPAQIEPVSTVPSEPSITFSGLVQLFDAANLGFGVQDLITRAANAATEAHDKAQGLETQAKQSLEVAQAEYDQAYQEALAKRNAAIERVNVMLHEADGQKQFAKTIEGIINPLSAQTESN